MVPEVVVDLKTRTVKSLISITFYLCKLSAVREAIISVFVFVSDFGISIVLNCYRKKW